MNVVACQFNTPGDALNIWVLGWAFVKTLKMAIISKLSDEFLSKYLSCGLVLEKKCTQL